MEGISLLRLARERIAAGEPVAEAVILASRGSVSRPAGARMLLLADGRFEGTVGGGAPEFACQRAAREAMAGAPARLLELDHGSTGMVCGGVQVAGVRRMGAASLPALTHALEALDAGRPAALELDWGGAEPVLRAADSAGAPKAPTWDGAVFTEPLRPAARVVIFGAGHVGRALTAQLALLDFDILIADDRPELMDPALFPRGCRAVACDYADPAAAGIALAPADLACILTASHQTDARLTAWALGRHPRYLGCMGSRRKAAVVRAELVERGFSPEEIASVDLPIGLAIGAVTPAEIALSIAARLVQVRAEGPVEG